MDAARTIGRSISVFAIASVLMVSCALPCELSSIHECQLLSYVENVEGSERGLGATRIDIADVLGASYFSTERGCALPVNVRIGMQEGMPVERVSFRALGEGFTVGVSEDSQSDVLTLPYESLEAFLDAVERDETVKYQGLRFRVVKMWLPAHVHESL